MMRQLRDIVRVTLAFLVIANATPTTPVHAAFTDLGVGARAPGMADTFVAIAEGADALYYNPAGLTQLGGTEISMQHGEHLRGTDDGSSLGTTYLGYAQPLNGGRNGTLGVAYHNFKAASLFTERTLFLSYGWKLKVQPLGLGGSWALGTSLKQFHRQYEPTQFSENALNDVGVATNEKDPLFAQNGYENDAYSVDVGAHGRYGPNDEYSAGLMIMNVNGPDTSLAGDGDKAPFITKVGFGYHPRWGVVSLEARRADRLASGADTDLALGAERRYKLNVGQVSMRGGYATGSRGFKNLTAGVSYEFAQARFDYAFNIPVGNLQKTDGDHRLGLTFRLNAGAPQLLPQDQSAHRFVPLFNRESAAAYAMIQEADLHKRLNPAQRVLLRQLLGTMFPMDEYILVATKEMNDLMSRHNLQRLDGANLKTALLWDLPESDRIAALASLNHLINGDDRSMRDGLESLSYQGKKDPMIETLSLLALTRLAAHAYRNNKLDQTIDHLRKMLDFMPESKLVMDAYRELIAQRAAAPASPRPLNSPELPEAPQALVAPVPQNSEPAVGLSEFESNVRSFGTMLGHYFTRKANGATVDEQRYLLRQMQSLYEGKGIDMSLVEKELQNLKGGSHLKAAPVKVEQPPQNPVAPVAKPAVKPSPKSAAPAPVKPAIRSTGTGSVDPTKNMDLDRSWAFYKSAVARGISDHERIEILERIKARFGAAGAAKVSSELERVRRRVQ